MFVIGTAGHVDHGKSTLVLALTGIDPDRLAEEKEREMTIDLGFAWLKLPSGREVGVVDVPGHEHFIKNMLAGVGGMDLALLVVDANESVKQQTREHVAILDLMEVKKSIVVITKADQADRDTITLVGMEMEDLLKATSLAGSPVVAVSSLTKQGLPDLLATIDRILDTAEPRRDIGKPRLPIDRVFTISGSGTVVTGTLLDGSLTVGQEVEIVPSSLKSRIRSLQTHKTQLNSIGPGSRVAANLVGINAPDLKRGYILTRPGWLTSTTMIDARLRVLAALSRPLRHNVEVSFHSGSAEVMARVRLLEKEEAEPGDITWAQFVLEEPLAAVNGDHYIIRSPMDTLGGGIIIDSHPRERHRLFRPDTIENLKARSEGKIEEAILATLRTKQPQDTATLVAQSSLSRDAAEAALESLIRQGTIVKIGDGKNSPLYTDSGWKKLADDLIAMVADYHRRFPLRLGMPKAEISSKVKLGASFAEALQKLFRDGGLVEEMALVRLPSHQIRLSAAQQSRIDSYLNQLSRSPYSPAPDGDLEPDLLNLLVERGQAVKTAAGVIFARSAYDEMVSRIMAHIKKNGKISVGEVRDMFQSSRKYVLPLLENMDEARLTRRVGDDRVAVEKAQGSVP